MHYRLSLHLEHILGIVFFAKMKMHGNWKRQRTQTCKEVTQVFEFIAIIYTSDVRKHFLNPHKNNLNRSSNGLVKIQERKDTEGNLRKSERILAIWAGKAHSHYRLCTINSL